MTDEEKERVARAMVTDAVIDTIRKRAIDNMRERCMDVVKGYLEGSGFNTQQKHAAKVILRDILDLKVEP